MADLACIPWHVNSSLNTILLSKTLDVACPVNNKFINSWVVCPNWDVIVVAFLKFGSSKSERRMGMDRDWTRDITRYITPPGCWKWLSGGDVDGDCGDCCCCCLWWEFEFSRKSATDLASVVIFFCCGVNFFFIVFVVVFVAVALLLGLLPLLLLNDEDDTPLSIAIGWLSKLNDTSLFLGRLTSGMDTSSSASTSFLATVAWTWYWSWYWSWYWLNTNAPSLSLSCSNNNGMVCTFNPNKEEAEVDLSSFSFALLELALGEIICWIQNAEDGDAAATASFVSCFVESSSAVVVVASLLLL